MSYLVLARKYRPQNFDDVIGQKTVVRILQNGLKYKRVAHAMLFSGVRGVGKTTLARIMAKALSCQEGDIDNPCSNCESCREIMAGIAVDLKEIDGASNRGIQEIRDLKEDIRFFPVKGRYKVVIIDEVHMLTNEAFNALLKTLEEPPAHVYFMFATTELYKIPVTILSRCQRYELQRVSFVELTDFFIKIATQEKVDISRPAVEMIAREAEGSVRDGLSLLDQIFSFGGDKISDQDVTQVLGLVDRSIFASVARALLAGDLVGSLTVFNRSYAAGIDLKRFVNDLLAYFRALMICKTISNPLEILDLSDQELTVLRGIAAEHSKETLYHCFNLLLQGTHEIQHASRPRMVVEMLFIKAVQTGEITSVSSLLERLDGLLHNVDDGVMRENDSLLQQVKESSAISYLSANAEKLPPEMNHSVGMVVKASQQDVRSQWDGFVEYVKERKVWMAHALRVCAGVSEEKRSLVLQYDDLYSCKVLKESENRRLLAEFVMDFFQKELKVKIMVRGDQTGNGNGNEDETPQEVRRALANDPLVQVVTEIFGGQVVAVRTGPRSR